MRFRSNFLGRIDRWCRNLIFMKICKIIPKTIEKHYGEVLEGGRGGTWNISPLSFCLLFLLTSVVPFFAQTVSGASAIQLANKMLSCDGESTKQEVLEKGFNYIFNGEDLSGWEGDFSLWSVNQGCIVGETTEKLIIKGSSFLTWKDGMVGDFELRLCFRIQGKNANSGIQYRSKRLPEFGKWKLGGYQADFDANNEYTGILYEASGRGVMTKRGEKVILLPDKKAKSQKLNKDGNLPPSPDRGLIKAGQWHEYRIIAKGFHFIHMIDDQVTVDVIDKDKRNRASKGLLGFQLHDGPPMKVEFKNIRLKKLYP